MTVCARPHPLPLAGLVALAPFGAAAGLGAPSGQPLTLQEVVTETDPWSGAAQIVVRLIAPGIADVVESADSLAADMAWACANWGVAAAAQADEPIEWVVVEMMQAPAPRGSATPETLRLFETYRLAGDRCIWELF